MRRRDFLAELAVAATAAAVRTVDAQSVALLAPTGTLRSSFIATNPVQGRVDAKTGAVSGPAEDLTRELARRLGVPYRVTPLPDAGAVLESVKSSRVDIGFLAVEAERATQVDFSDAYSSSGAAYAVRANAPFQNSADVDRAGVTIGAISGQAPEVYVREHVKNARLQSLPSVPPNADMGKMLLDGKVDAFGRIARGWKSSSATFRACASCRTTIWRRCRRSSSRKESRRSLRRSIGSLPRFASRGSCRLRSSAQRSRASKSLLNRSGNAPKEPFVNHGRAACG